jgi:antitoxin Phd
MGKIWALQDAKNRLSEVIHKAEEEGPQTITRHGKDVAIVVSVGEFKKLAAPAGDLVKFLRSSPLAQVGIDLSRDDDRGREIDL